MGLIFGIFNCIHISINGTKEAWYPDRTKLVSIAKQEPAHGLLWPKETFLPLQEQNRQDRSIPMFPNLSGSQRSAIKRDRPGDKELHTHTRRSRGARGTQGQCPPRFAPKNNVRRGSQRTVSTMKQHHLNKCLLMHCNKSITDTLETVNIAKRFSCANVRGKGQEILSKGMSIVE